EWHGKSIYVLNRHNGKLIQEIDLVDGPEVKNPKFGGKTCHDPAHVMTRVDTQQVHVGCNGDDMVVEFNRDPVSGLLSIHQFISMSKNPGVDKQAQPHAHWMGFDGKSMVTPNSNTGDSTLFNFNEYKIVEKQPTGTLPIATGIMPDSSKYYVSNYLGDTISVLCGPYPKTGCVPGTVIKTLNLLDDNADNSGYITNGRFLDPTTPAANLPGPAGGFSVQTPVSPDGKFVVIGNTLSGTITIIDTATDTLVRSIPGDPGCHGVNFGAKKGGGYYAYVTSKFANRLIVLDPDPNNDGKADDAVIVGAVVLADDHVAKDDRITGNRGMGGQGVMPVPTVYNGWVQELPIAYKAQLTKAQRNPLGKKGHQHHDDDDDHDHGDDR
ncbi:MAG TPA: YncE family protein, partial [Nitrospira sp.]|nr:YncE family protein [Nitrospira sp.]